MKKLVFLSVLMVMLLALTGCVSSSNELDISSMTEKEKYYNAHADLTCVFYTDENALESGSPEAAVAKYGFTVQDVVALSDKYKDDQEAQEGLANRMMEVCPEVLQQAAGQ